MRYERMEKIHTHNYNDYDYDDEDERKKTTQKLDNGKRKIHIHSKKLHLFVCTHMRLQ